MVGNEGTESIRTELRNRWASKAIGLIVFLRLKKSAITHKF